MRVEAVTRELLPFLDQSVALVVGQHGLEPVQDRVLDRFVGDRKHLEIVQVTENAPPNFVAGDCLVIDTSSEPATGELALSERNGKLFVEHYYGTFISMGRVVGHLRNELARNPFRNSNLN